MHTGQSGVQCAKQALLQQLEEGYDLLLSAGLAMYR
jgi:hypothetical protein